MNIVAAQEREMWATLGLLRGVFSSQSSGHAFCTPQWINLMVGIIKKSSALNPFNSQTKALVQQVLTLRMLRAVLPSWEAGTNTKQQQMLIEEFFSLLGQVLVLCSSPFLKQSMRMGEFPALKIFSSAYIKKIFFKKIFFPKLKIHHPLKKIFFCSLVWGFI